MMESMEERLQKYRKEKMKNDLLKFNISWEPVKYLFKNPSVDSSLQQRILNDDDDDDGRSSEQHDAELINSDENIENNSTGILNKSDSNNYSKKCKILILLLWIIALYIFIKIEFALVFICLSMLTFICLNTRTNKHDNEISAYSVFNKDCTPIDGTLDANQIDSEIRGGFTALR